MGVPGLGKVINENYGESVTKHLPNGVTPDYTAIDLNGAFYGVWSEISNTGKAREALEKTKSYDEIAKRDRQVAQMTFEDIVEAIFLGTTRYIEQTVVLTQPKKGLIIGVDGLAPIAKLNHQRARRIKSAQAHAKTQVAGEKLLNGSANFTPGTELMFVLNNKLKLWLANNSRRLPPTIWFSDHMDEGEGEHKLLKYIRLNVNPNDTVVINGMDGDLIMLGLLLPHHCIILRSFNFRLYFEFMPERSQATFIDINVLKHAFQRDNIGINEFVYSMFLFGNDFLPAQPGLDDIQEAFPLYLQVITGRKFVLGNTLDVEAWQDFIRALLPIQYQLIAKLATTPLKHPFVLAQQAMEGPDLNVDEFTQIWTDRIFDADFAEYTLEDVEVNTIEYMTTLQWVWRYYHDHKSVRWSHAYSRIFAPLLNQLVDAESIYDITPNETYQIDVMTQLMVVLPRLSRGIAPEQVQPIYDLGSPLYDLYPADINYLLEGKTERQEFLAVPLLPHLPYDRIVEAKKSLKISQSVRARYAEVSPVIWQHGFTPRYFVTDLQPHHLKAKPTGNRKPKIAEKVETTKTISQERLYPQLYALPSVQYAFPVLDVVVRA